MINIDFKDIEIMPLGTSSSLDGSNLKIKPKVIRFEGLTDEEIDISLLDTSNMDSMQSFFASCTNLKCADFTSIDTSHITSMNSIFSACTSLEEIKTPPNFAMNVKNMQRMFYNCKSLENLDMSNWNVQNVTDMGNKSSGTGTFYGIKAKSLDLSSWNTTNLTSIGGSCFGGAGSYSPGNIEYLKLGNFDTSKLTTVGSAFYYANNLTVLIWNNFGNGSGYTSFSFEQSSILGVDSEKYPNARQALTDTFVTNSFDRATANYPTCTITFHTKTKNLFSDDEIAQITAKGYTIA